MVFVKKKSAAKPETSNRRIQKARKEILADNRFEGGEAALFRIDSCMIFDTMVRREA